MSTVPVIRSGGLAVDARAPQWVCSVSIARATAEAPAARSGAGVPAEGCARTFVRVRRMRAHLSGVPVFLQRCGRTSVWCRCSCRGMRPTFVQVRRMRPHLSGVPVFLQRDAPDLCAGLPDAGAPLCGAGVPAEGCARTSVWCRCSCRGMRAHLSGVPVFLQRDAGAPQCGAGVCPAPQCGSIVCLFFKTVCCGTMCNRWGGGWGARMLHAACCMLHAAAGCQKITVSPDHLQMLTPPRPSLHDPRAAGHRCHRHATTP